MLASWVFIGFMLDSLALLVVGIVLLDLGGQAIHVINQSMIFSTRPEARECRVLACFSWARACSGLGAPHPERRFIFR
jgi:hypothetical protein